MAPAAGVIVPLYIYPAPNAWASLHACIETHPRTQFWVIVNPGNGPGPDTIPDANYLREIPKLNAYANVSVLGYVHTTFTTRNLSDVLQDVDTYSRWVSSGYTGLSVSGIFVDETPNQFTTQAAKFLRELTIFAKSRSGMGPNPLVIHNPGSVPAPAYLRLADVSVVFEDTWQVFLDRVSRGLFHQLREANTHASTQRHGSSATHDRIAVMIHSIPHDMDETQMMQVVHAARDIGGLLYLTDLDVQYYQSFSARWLDWVRLIAT